MLSDPTPSLSKTRTLLENINSSLISWGIDVRLDSGSLSTIDDDPIAEVVRCTLEQLSEELQTLYNSASYTPRSSLRRIEETALSQRPAGKIAEISPAAENPRHLVIRLIRLLQDMVRPVQSVQAMKSQEGPYGDMRRIISHVNRFHTGIDHGLHPDNENLSSTPSLGDNLRHDGGELDQDDLQLGSAPGRASREYPRLSASTLSALRTQGHGDSRLSEWAIQRDEYEELAVRGYSDRSYHRTEMGANRYHRELEQREVRAAEEQKKRMKEQKQVEKQEKKKPEA